MDEIANTKSAAGEEPTEGTATKGPGKPRHIVRKVLLALLAVILILVGAFSALYFTRFQTMSSIKETTSYDSGYNLYAMNVGYDYDLDAMLSRDVTSDQDFYDMVLASAFPLLPIHMDATDSGCTVFGIADSTTGNQLVGRNYDFHSDTSAMLVHTKPKNGYESIGSAPCRTSRTTSPTRVSSRV